MTTPQRIITPPCAQPGAPSPLQATGRPLRWGVVSTGRIAGKVTGDLALLEDAVLQAVSSRVEANATAFAGRFNFARAYFDNDDGKGYDQLFADPDVDVVYVATPHGQHYEIAKLALEAGKHVLCEKSLTINAREALELAELARSRKLFLMEAVWTRFLPIIHRAWDITHSGELGEIQWLQADLGFPAPYDATARLWNPAAGGGALLDLTVYPLTWALGVLGFPQTVLATGHINDDGVDAQNALTLTYGSGAQAQLTSSLLSSSPQTATVCGSAGWLRTGTPLHHPNELTIHRHGGEQRLERFGRIGQNYVYELREVTRCIQEGLSESPTMPLEDTLNTMRLFDGVRAQIGVSYANDRAVPVLD
ncbi:dehydrogenase [Arthrobacter crystallopoietes BAB-32]|uniref:Dehydrogenase n=1 Tax=Arthrobacter crystallopoietes BAB-32 TaxID=1246476 RepID=N1UX33_9MICC|nr:Gfo/Idh/MocA family oxidoreductase [Arthrobacter crystallopoietes]EMY32387.1 dehydrogenase [Arthrobacter crystallopoietes BAB-32]